MNELRRQFTKAWDMKTPWETCSQCHDAARAAIEAMMEPTLAMRKVCSFETAEVEYPAMIRSALEEGK